jgi:hypothetical protein
LLELNTLRKIIFLIFILSFWLFFNKPILASDNIFGLHLTQPEDLSAAKDIINSNGGDWGWVTIVIPLNQLNHQTWQDFFDQCRQDHLIPIVRLATNADGDNWKAPSISDIDNLASFLNSLNWPTQQQYIILFNEINHGQEWGGEVNVKNYVDMSIYASQKFKSLNPNFFVLGSALDLAAPEKMPNFKSAQNIYQEIYTYNPTYFDNIDGLASHSYPNHGFIGTPKDTGQHSIRGYIWELNFIKNLGVNKTFPVFITETGWPHREGFNSHNNFYTTTTTAKFLLDSYNIWSKDDRVKAVTPFIYNYSQLPFDHFSWLDKDQKMYPAYQCLVDQPKFQNQPEQTTKYEIYNSQVPFIIFTNNEYTGQISLKNTGQSIWGESNFCLKPIVNNYIEITEICTKYTDYVLPNQIKIFSFKFKIKDGSSAKINLAWENLDNSIEISPFSDNSVVFHPKFNLIDQIKSFFTNFW